MKILITAFCINFCFAIMAGAQDTASNNNRPAEQEMQIVNEKIEPRDLPDAVKQALESNAYQGKIVNAVYKTPMKDPDHPNQINNVTYIIELVVDDQIETLTFDSAGNRISDDQD
jgi:hypothetical protein